MSNIVVKNIWITLFDETSSSDIQFYHPMACV